MPKITMTPEANQIVPQNKISVSNQHDVITNVEDQSSAIDVRKMNIYSFMSDAFNGTGGFRDGTYLIPHPREAFYITRGKSAYYKNFFKAIIRAMVDPVFNADINRGEYPEGDMLGGFLENCDNKGTDFHAFVKNQIKTARVLGVAYTVIDNFKNDDMPNTMLAASEQRAYPYVYGKLPQEVKAIELDKFNNIISIMFFDKKTKSADGRDVNQYRKWDRKQWTLFVETEKIDKDGNLLLIEIASGLHNLGVVPVVAISDFVETTTGNNMADPPLFDLARMNYMLYQCTSQIESMKQAQCHSIFYTVGLNVKDIKSGVFNFLNLPSDTKTVPGFASPDSAHIVNLFRGEEIIREDIYRIAEQNGVIGIKAQTSGISKEWDFRAQESVLKTTATAAARFEKNIVDIFGKYIGTTIEYNPEYPMQYSPTYEQDRIDQIMIALDKIPPQIITEYLWREYAEIYWKNKPEIIDAVDAALESNRQMQNIIKTGAENADIQQGE